MTNNNKNKIVGIIATTVFHVLALVMLLTLCFRTPLPLPGEAGVEVDMGMYAQAMNQETNEHISQQVNETMRQETFEEINEVEEDILSDDEELPSIEEHKIEEQEKSDETEDLAEEKPVVNQRALFQIKKVNNKPDSEGNKEDGIGEQGNPNGLKDISRYEGNGGSGGGPAYDLGGRGAKSISSPSRDFKEEGKVVVDIWVDRDGKVQRAEIGKGTTIFDSNMLESSKKAAINSIFNKDDKATELQRGTITYTFIMRQ